MQPFGTVPAVVDGDYKIFGTIFKENFNICFSDNQDHKVDSNDIKYLIGFVIYLCLVNFIIDQTSSVLTQIDSVNFDRI